MQPDEQWQWDRLFTEVGSELQREELEVMAGTEQNDRLQRLDDGDRVMMLTNTPTH